jgi:CarD family transcriptional regulator
VVKPKSRGGRVAAPALVDRLIPAQAGQEGNLSVETIRINFKAGDMAVHPAHGVGEVQDIEEKDFGGGRKTPCYVIKIRDSGLKVMVPTEAASRVGLRPVMKKKEAQKILDILKAPEVAVDLQPWNRRFRAYTEMLKSGLPSEIAKVLRDMYRLKFDKDLSFGERRLLDQAKSLLVKELALAKQMQLGAMEGEISQILSA